MTTHLQKTFAKTFYAADLYFPTKDQVHAAPASKSSPLPGNPADSCGSKYRSASGLTHRDFSQSGAE
jgi:hypothetical protein